MTSGDNHSRLPPAVWAFLSAFNERSVAGMAACLAPAAEYVNLSHAQPFRGKQVGDFARVQIIPLCMKRSCHTLLVFRVD